MSMAQAILAELDQETPATIRLLQSVPADKLGWKPHEKSMSLGQLAQHIAMTPGPVAEMLEEDNYEMNMGGTPDPDSAESLMPTFEASVSRVNQLLGAWDDDKAMSTWRVLSRGKELMAMPRIAAARMIILNHIYHHRGQLTVYLRMLDVPVPSVYGPSADDNPFAA